MFGRHSLTQRRRELLKIESQEELAGGLIPRQLGQHGVHHVCRLPVAQLHSGQELREQGGVRGSISLKQARVLSSSYGLGVAVVIVCRKRR